MADEHHLAVASTPLGNAIAPWLRPAESSPMSAATGRPYQPPALMARSSWAVPGLVANTFGCGRYLAASRADPRWHHRRRAALLAGGWPPLPVLCFEEDEKVEKDLRVNSTFYRVLFAKALDS